MSLLSPSQIAVVLVSTIQPGNIGATARAMDNMGVTDLRLVNPCETDHPETRMFAMSARYIVEQARVFDHLRAALGDRRLVIGTSARRRDKIHTSRNILELPDLIAGCDPGLPIALVFGPEQSGLSNEDMSCCNEWMHIPTFGRVNSLNLAQSVMVFLYEHSRLYETPADEAADVLVPAPSDQVEGMKDHFFKVLDRIGYLRHNTHHALWNSFADLIGRAKPDERDVRMIRGFFNRIEVTLDRAGKDGES